MTANQVQLQLNGGNLRPRSHLDLSLKTHEMVMTPEKVLVADFISPHKLKTMSTGLHVGEKPP